MSRSFSVAEPHPTVPKTGAFLAGGRGGAGNYHRYKATDLTTGPDATGPPSRLPLSRSTAPRTVTVGRGGAGNRHKSPEVEESIFQFDEEMAARRDSQAPVYHIGRGGAANWVDESKPRTQRLGSTGSSGSTASTDSAGSVRRSIEGALGKLQRKISRQ